MTIKNKQFRQQLIRAFGIRQIIIRHKCAGANTLAQGKFDYEGCREGYINSLNRLRKEKVDVFIGNHVWNNDTLKKGELLLATGENQFIDDKLWGTFLDFCEERLQQVILAEK